LALQHTTVLVSQKFNIAVVYECVSLCLDKRVQSNLLSTISN